MLLILNTFDKSYLGLHILQENHKVDNVKLVNERVQFNCCESMNIYKTKHLLMKFKPQSLFVSSRFMFTVYP